MSLLDTFPYLWGKYKCTRLLDNQGQSIAYEWANELNCKTCGLAVFVSTVCNESIHTSLKNSENRFQRYRLSRNQNWHHKTIKDDNSKKLQGNDGIPYTASIFLIEEESTVDNSDNLSVRPNDNPPLTYDINESIKYFGNNDSTKKWACIFGGNCYLQHNKCLQIIRW